MAQGHGSGSAGISAAEIGLNRSLKINALNVAHPCTALLYCSGRSHSHVWSL